LEAACASQHRVKLSRISSTQKDDDDALSPIEREKREAEVTADLLERAESALVWRTQS
jgi:hypothetical protein